MFQVRVNPRYWQGDTGGEGCGDTGGCTSGRHTGGVTPEGRGEKIPVGVVLEADSTGRHRRGNTEGG